MTTTIDDAAAEFAARFEEALEFLSDQGDAAPLPAEPEPPVPAQRDATEPPNRIAAISFWAETYYPDRTNPPPPQLATIQLSEQELIDLFNATTSRAAHLALVDKAPIRDAFGGPVPSEMVYTAIRASWNRSVTP